MLHSNIHFFIYLFIFSRHAVDTLISLAKYFPSHFLPHQGKESEDTKSDSKKSSVSGAVTGAISKNSKGNASSSGQASESSDFWELLVKLDSISVSRKGKGLPRTHSSAGGGGDEEQRVTTLEASPLGQLIQQLAHPVVRRSSLLTDRLLRLLALISLGLPETPDSSAAQSSSAAQHSMENSQTLEHLLSLAIQVRHNTVLHFNKEKGIKVFGLGNCSWFSLLFCLGSHSSVFSPTIRQTQTQRGRGE